MIDRCWLNDWWRLNEWCGLHNQAWDTPPNIMKWASLFVFWECQIQQNPAAIVCYERTPEDFGLFSCRRILMSAYYARELSPCWLSKSNVCADFTVDSCWAHNCFVFLNCRLVCARNCVCRLAFADFFFLFSSPQDACTLQKVLIEKKREIDKVRQYLDTCPGSSWRPWKVLITMFSCCTHEHFCTLSCSAHVYDIQTVMLCTLQFIPEAFLLHMGVYRRRGWGHDTTDQNWIKASRGLRKLAALKKTYPKCQRPVHMFWYK